MKTYEKLFDEIFKSIPFAEKHRELIHKKTATAYALQVGEDVRQRCYENATITENFHGGEPAAWVDSKSILNTEIILP